MSYLIELEKEKKNKAKKPKQAKPKPIATHVYPVGGSLNLPWKKIFKLLRLDLNRKNHPG